MGTHEMRQDMSLRDHVSSAAHGPTTAERPFDWAFPLRFDQSACAVPAARRAPMAVIWMLRMAAFMDGSRGSARVDAVHGL
jgi:hypothetical protein